MGPYPRYEARHAPSVLKGQARQRNACGLGTRAQRSDSKVRARCADSAPGRCADFALRDTVRGQCPNSALGFEVRTRRSDLACGAAFELGARFRIHLAVHIETSSRPRTSTAAPAPTLYIQQDEFRDQFAADVAPDRADLMAVTQRPIVQSALEWERSLAG